MKTIKSFTKVLLFGLMATIAITACKEDDFTEEDLLRLQNDLALDNDSIKAARAAAALNQAGELLSYGVMVVSNSNKPVEGAEVTLLAASQNAADSIEGGSADTQTLTTDANGQVFFEKAVIGGNTIHINAEGYFDVVAYVDFGSLNYNYYEELNNGEIIPKPVTENSIIPLFQDGSGSDFATVTGKVLIETDLTNDTPEVPQDLQIKANLNNFASQFNDGGSVGLQVYSFQNGGDLNIGVGNVDNTTGEFEILVPTTPEGLYVNFIVPQITTDQTLAIESRNGTTLETPELVEVPTAFGYSTGGSYDNVNQTIPSFYLEYSAPEAAGAGVDFTFTRHGRPLLFSTGTFFSTSPLEIFGDDLIIRVSDAGSNLENSPQVTVNDSGDGNGALLEAYIELSINGLTLDVSGSGFAADTWYNFDLYYDHVYYTGDGTETDTTTSNVFDFNVLAVRTNAAGEITSDSVAAALEQAIADGDDYFDVENPMQIGYWIANLRLVNTDETEDAVITVSSATGSVYQFRVLSTGDDYVDPSFSFSGGGGDSPVLDVLSFGTQWEISIDNSGITSPYNLLPSNIDFEYKPVTVGSTSLWTVDDLDYYDGSNATDDILNLLEVSDAGEIEFVDKTQGFMTGFYSASEPTVIINEPISSPAYTRGIEASVNDAGTITGINIYAGGSNDDGAGYADKFTVTVVPFFSGEGANVQITGGDYLDNGEYDWDFGFNIVNGGTGYTDNVNQQDRRNYSSPIGAGVGSIYLQSGETRNYVIDYGTGNRLEDVY